MDAPPGALLQLPQQPDGRDALRGRQLFGRAFAAPQNQGCTCCESRQAGRRRAPARRPMVRSGTSRDSALTEPAFESPGAILRRRQHSDITSVTSTWRSRAVGASFFRCNSGIIVRCVGCDRGGSAWPAHDAAPAAANIPGAVPRDTPKERGPRRPGPPRGRGRGGVSMPPPPQHRARRRWLALVRGWRETAGGQHARAVPRAEPGLQCRRRRGRMRARARAARPGLRMLRVAGRRGSAWRRLGAPMHRSGTGHRWTTTLTQPALDSPARSSRPWPRARPSSVELAPPPSLPFQYNY